jgi:hypothetical protein
VGSAKGPSVTLDNIEGHGFFQCKGVIDVACNSLALEFVLFFVASLLGEAVGWVRAVHYHNPHISLAEFNN